MLNLSPGANREEIFDNMIKTRGKRKGKDASHLIEIYLGRNPDGSRNYYRETFHGTDRQAELREAELKTKFCNPSGPLKGAMYLSNFMDHWLDRLKGEIEDNSHQNYVNHVKRLKPLVGDLALYAITATELQMRLKNQFNSLKHKTVKNIYSTLRAMLRAAVAEDRIPRDPTVGLKTPRRAGFPQEEPYALNKEELFRLLDVLPNYKHQAILRLIAVTGLRISEAEGLTWRNVDFTHSEITIRQAADIRKRELKSKTKSPAGQRTIRLDDETIALLRQHKKDQAVKSFLVFQENGRVLKYSSVAKALDRALKKAGLTHISPHDLRHSVASILLDAGESLSLVAALLGHANVGVTAAIYSHKLRKGESIIRAITNEADKPADKRRGSR